MSTSRANKIEVCHRATLSAAEKAEDNTDDVIGNPECTSQLSESIASVRGMTRQP